MASAPRWAPSSRHDTHVSMRALAFISFMAAGCMIASSGLDSQTGSSGSSSSASSGSGGGSICAGTMACTGTISHLCGQPPASGTDCAAKGQVCVPDLGCSACKPGSGTCAPQGATFCRKDGSGTIEFACDADLGLSCQGDVCVGPCAPSNIEDDYIGCEYFPTTVINDVNNTYDFEVAVANASATDPATVTVSGGGLGAPKKVMVPPGGVQSINLPWVDQVKVCNETTPGSGFDQVNACSAAHNPDYSSRVVAKGAYRLASDRPVAAYQFAPIQGAKGGFQAGTTEAALLLPATVFGTRYRVATYGQGFARGAVAVVATVDGTTVTVQPTFDVTPGGGNPSGIGAGKSGTYPVNRGDVLEIISAAAGSNDNTGDLSGSLITADHPVQVIGAHGCAWVVNTQSCDHIEDSMFPDGTLGNDYLVKAATYPGSIAYLVRVVAAEDNVTVTFDPPSVAMPQTLVKAGELFDVAGPDLSARITSTGRILVAGLNEGDNTLAAVVPTARFRSDYLFYVPSFQHNYGKLLAPLGASVTIDGTTVDANAWTKIGASGFAWAIVPLLAGAHRASSSQPFGLMVYGNQDVNYVPGGLPSAYEYSGGLDLHATVIGTPK